MVNKQKFLGFIKKHPVISIILLFIYILSPIDIVPEMLTGVFGFFDDLLLTLLFIIHRFIQKKQRGKTIDKP